MNDFESLKPRLGRMQNLALLVGLLGLAVSAVGYFTDAEQFYRSYLFGYLFWIGLALGSLALLALHHLVGGGWGFVIQRLLESSTRTLPVLALLFLPFWFGMASLYVWARPEVVAADELLQHKALYLNVSFFWLRAAAYFAIWGLSIFFLNRWSKMQDETGDAGLTARIQKLSGPTILLYVLTITFASIDWVMSLEPHWFSTIFGFIFVIGQAVLTLAFAILLVAFLAGYKPLSEVVRKQHFHDLGNLMLAFVALWAYISLSQFLIIWSGNLPEEIPWYLHRLHGGWEWVGLALVVFHFAVPFVLLLSRRTKRNIEILAKVALVMIVMRLVDLYWIVAPNFYPEQVQVHWLDLVTPLGIGGIWVAAFLWQLKTRALLPLRDPRMKEAFSHE